MSTERANPIRRIYLLTVWREAEQPETEASWRFLVEDLRTGRRKGFAGVAALVEGLLEMVTEEAQPSTPLDDKES